MSDNLHSSDKNIESHVQSYEGMLTLFKVGIVVSVLILLGMAVFLVR